MRRLFKAFFFLFVVGALGLVAYAYVGDLSPQQRPVALPVVLNVE